MATHRHVFLAGLGHDAGAGADGVLLGSITATAPTKAYLETVSQAVLCYTDDGGAYVDKTTDMNDAGANDVNLLPAVPAVDDALYLGHATKQFGQVDLTIGTAGVGTWTVAWQYWNGTAWTALNGVTDGTSHFMAAAGAVAVTFSVPPDWAKCTVDGVNGYWVRANVATYAAVTTQPLGTVAWVVCSRTEGVFSVADDGGVQTDETAVGYAAGANDMTLLPAVAVAEDAYYFGCRSKFNVLTLTIGTQGVGTWTITWEYWNGTAWATLTCTDNTTGFKAAAGARTVTFNPPAAWASTTVGARTGYFIRGRLSSLTTYTTEPLGTSAICTVVASDSLWTSYLTEINEATANDVFLLPVHAAVHDAFYLGFTSKFCKAKVTYSTARTGTATLVWEYWNGAYWATLSTVVDDAVGWVTAAGTRVISFQPPSDWVANTAANGPNAQTGFFIRCRLSALTSYTAQPLGDRAYLYPVNGGATGDGPPMIEAGTFIAWWGNAATISGTTADSVFLLVNLTKATWAVLTWTKATKTDSETIALAFDAGDELALVQVAEDGTTELANVNLYVQTAA